jgi:hypothetical protein
MHYFVQPDSTEHRTTVDVAFVDPDGYLVMMMEALEASSSEALNRLRGQRLGAASPASRECH